MSDEPHYRRVETEGARYRPYCSCGWKGRLTPYRDSANTQHTGHTVKLWRAADAAKLKP
jgi:hypothetical protein